MNAPIELRLAYMLYAKRSGLICSELPSVSSISGMQPISATACNIKSWMALRKVTNGQVAKQAHVSETMVSYVINGKRVSAPIYKTIARLCRVSLPELLAGPASAEQNSRRAA